MRDCEAAACAQRASAGGAAVTLGEARGWAAMRLSGVAELRENAARDADMLLMHALGLDRAALIAHPERSLTREQLADIQRLVERRLRFEPIQYILGTQEFYGLQLKVSPAVLIPRPETEILVETVLARLNKSVPHSSQPHRDAWDPPQHPVRVIDIGTGSGAIAIALAVNLPQAQVTALDLSPTALDVARENAAMHGVAGCIRFLESDLLAAVAAELAFDAIVSNPPYIPDADAPTLHAFVDASVIELIAGERIGYTQRFYYEGPAPDVRASASGSGVTMAAWRIVPISENRLTTPARLI